MAFALCPWPSALLTMRRMEGGVCFNFGADNQFNMFFTKQLGGMHSNHCEVQGLMEEEDNRKRVGKQSKSEGQHPLDGPPTSSRSSTPQFKCCKA